MPTGSTTNFVAPNVMTDTLLTFQLTVNDGASMASVTVDVLVQAQVGTSSSSGSGGAGGMGMGTGGSATGGEAGAGGSRPPIVTDKGGCDCSVPGSNDSTPMRNAGSSILALFGAWLVRRRRSGKPS
jgi:MYXO-CTERM domain-containing protein